MKAHLLALALTPLALMAENPVVPVLETRIPDRNAVAGQTLDVAISGYFGTREIRDQVVRFEVTALEPNPKVIDIALFRNEAPGTVANFLNYVNDGDYINSIFHRLVPGFVLQGGGIDFVNNSFNFIPVDPPIANEFNVSNTRATLAMAKLGSGADTATSQFFFNLANNGDNLDLQNGGFTVFGVAVGGKMAIVDELSDTADYIPFDIFPDDPNDPLSDTPLGDADSDNEFETLQIVTGTSLVDVDGSHAGTDTNLTYELVAYSGPEAATLNGGVLSIAAPDTLPEPLTRTVTVRASDSVGNVVEDTFQATFVEGESFAQWQAANFTGAELSDPSVSGETAEVNGAGLTNLERYLHGLDRNRAPGTVVNVAHSASGTVVTVPIRNNAGEDFSVVLEGATTLGPPPDWVPLSVTEIGRTTSGDVDTVRFRVNGAFPDGAAPAYVRAVFTLGSAPAQ